jgi:hypothetical protein
MIHLTSGLSQRLSLLGGQHSGEVARVFLDQPSGAIQDSRALLDVHPRPLAERAQSGRNCKLDVLRRACRNAIDDILCRRVDDLENLVSSRLTPLASDQHLPARCLLLTTGRDRHHRLTLTAGWRDYTCTSVSQVSYIEPEQLAPRTETEVQAHIAAGKLVEGLRHTSPKYLEGMRRILTVSADTELVSAPSYLRADS